MRRGSPNWLGGHVMAMAAAPNRWRRAPRPASQRPPPCRPTLGMLLLWVFYQPVVLDLLQQLWGALGHQEPQPFDQGICSSPAGTPEGCGTSIPMGTWTTPELVCGSSEFGRQRQKASNHRCQVPTVHRQRQCLLMPLLLANLPQHPTHLPIQRSFRP